MAKYAYDGNPLPFNLENRIENLIEFSGISIGRRMRHLKIKARKKILGRDISPQARLHMKNLGETKKSWLGSDLNRKDVLRKQKEIRDTDRAAQWKSNKLVVGAGVVPPALATGASISASAYYSKKR